MNKLDHHVWRSLPSGYDIQIKLHSRDGAKGRFLSNEKKGGFLSLAYKKDILCLSDLLHNFINNKKVDE